MARTGNGSSARGKNTPPRKSTGKVATPAYDVPDPIQRGFGNTPEVRNESSDLLSIKRTDTLEIPRVVHQNPFEPAPTDGGIESERALVGAAVTVESQANLMLQYLMSMGPSIPLQFGSPSALTQQAGIHILPVYIDELERDFGTQMYHRMMNDAVVQARTETLIDGILDRPIVISPGVNEDDDALDATVSADTKRFREFATEVAEFVQANLDDMRGGFALKLRAMLQGIPLGYKLAEMVYERREPRMGMGLMTCIKDIHPKPHEAVSIVADGFNTVLGYLPRLRGTGVLGAFTFGELGVRTVEDTDGDTIRDRVSIPDLLPPEKMCRFTWMAHDDSPLGTSHLRAAYIPWRLKIGLYPAYEAYLARFAQPSAALELHGAEVAAMAATDGSMLTQPAQIIAALLYNLQNWRAGGAMVVPIGDLDLKEAAGNGEAYLAAFELCDQQITARILHADLNTAGAKYGTQALGEVHQDTTDMLYALGKYVAAMFVREEIVRPLVWFNYGEAGLMALPDVAFGETEQQDQTAIGGMLASLKGAELLFPPQYNDAFRMVGLPELPEDIITLLTDMWKQSMKQQAQAAEQQLAMGQAAIDGAQQQQRMDAANPGQPPGGMSGPGGTGGAGQPGAGRTGQRSASQGQAKPAKQDYFGE